MERIFIVGYMGSGKTTVGKRLAVSLSLTFVDLDAYIQSKYRKTIPQLFEEKGEEGFRTLEHQTLLEVAEFEDVVISTGGGAPCFYDNMEFMNRSGTTIYLQADAEELADRLTASKTVRPLIAGKSREELVPFITGHLAQREHFYTTAQIIFPTGHIVTKKDIHLTVSGLEDALRNRNKK